MFPLNQGPGPRQTAELLAEIKRLLAENERLRGHIYASDRPQPEEIERLRLSLGEIAAMGPADKEWDADTLEDAVAVAKRALGDNGPTTDGR